MELHSSEVLERMESIEDNFMALIRQPVKSSRVHPLDLI